jgi:NAD(P)-dependent dehydrogenase (short-subunit alcohol dehydrogenase family)
MKTAVITGISGSLGAALGAHYRSAGWKVIGVSRRKIPKAPSFDRLLVNAQAEVRDARRILSTAADLYILCAGAIETNLGPRGEPLQEALRDLTRINYLFPAAFALEASEKAWGHPVDVVLIGSIADGSPSAFGPLYHASKVALHHFVSGAAPILRGANPRLRVRLYRPGVIKGPLSWAPVNRLAPRGRKIRARRCESAPPPERVAAEIARWIEKGGTVGSSKEPLSFHILKHLFALAPGAYARLQAWAWNKAGRWPAPVSRASRA